jgi:hypothetical protein
MIVFGASAAAKLRGRGAYRSYRDGLAEAGLVPGKLLPATAAALAACEALLAAGSASAVALAAAALPGAVAASWAALAGAIVLASVLTAGVGVAIRRGAQASCACFGAASARPLGPAQLARNLSLVAAITAGLIAQGLAPGTGTLAATALGVVAGAVIALMLIRLDDLIDLFAPSQAGQVSSVRTAPRQGNVS